jgi:hypothetical protein
MPEHYLVAYIINWAVTGVGTKEGPLNDAMILSNNRELLLAKQVYDMEYSMSKKDKKMLKKETKVQKTKHNVKYKYVYEDDLLKRIAPDLFESDFSDPNFDFDKKIRSIHDKGTMARDIADDTSGEYKKTLLTLLDCDRSEGALINEEQLREDAKTLYESGEKRLGTNDKIFIAIFTKRSPDQIKIIAKHYPYFSKKDRTLQQAIRSETSSNYKDLLLGLTYPKIEYRARKIWKCIDGLGTQDKRLMFLIASCPYDERKDLKVAYQRVNDRDLIKDIKGDTSGEYQRTLLELLK